MGRLKECKNFGEIYEVIGEENFSDVAKLLINIMIASPLFWAVINFVMLLDGSSYNAYTYNDKVMGLMYAIFGVITLWSCLYYFGRLELEKISVKAKIAELKENNPWLLFWFVLLIWTIVPICFSASIVGAIMGASFLASGYISHIMMLGVLGCAAMIKQEDCRDVLKSFVAIADVLAVLMLSYEYGIPFLKKFSSSFGLSVYTNENHYGYYMSIACLLMCGLFFMNLEEQGSKKEAIILMVSFALNMYALMINDTLGAYLAIVFACPILLIIWKCSGRRVSIKHWIPVLLIVIITTLSAMNMVPSARNHTIGQSLVTFWQDIFKVAEKTEGYEKAGSKRIEVWLDTIDMISERPIVGYGPDIKFNKAGREALNTAHNEYLECALYLGIPGLILYLGGLITLLINKCKNIKKINIYELIAAGAAIAYLISAFFGVRKFNSVCFFFLVMGLLVEKDNLKKN